MYLYLEKIQTLETLLIAGIIFAGLYYANLARTGQNIVWSKADFKSIDLDGFTPVIHATLRAQNTGNATVEINSMAASVTANGYQVGNVSSFIQTPIPGNSQVDVSVELSLGLVGIVSDIVNAIKTGSRSQELVIDGWANANGIQVPINLKMSV